MFRGWGCACGFLILHIAHHEIMAMREPHPRFWHSAVSVQGKIYVRGGSTPKFDTDEGKRELATTIEEYDPVNQVWHQLKTTGTFHPGLSAVACTAFGDYMYAYGGSDGSELHAVLSQLDMKTLVWTQLSLEAVDGPMRKDACGMAYFDINKLAVIGGYADPSGPIQQGSTFILNEFFNEGSGWTDEFHVFDIMEGSWSSPIIEGTRPPPCADFTLTSIDSHRAVLYGGCRPPEGKRLDKDLYLINFSSMEMVRIEAKQGELWPVVTVGQHAACCLGFNTEHPQLLVTGGRSNRDRPLEGTWLFDIADKRWSEVKLHGTQTRRWGHSAASVTLPSKARLEEVIIFGGTSADYEYGWKRLRADDFPRLAETTVIKFEYVGSWVLYCEAKDRDLRKMSAESIIPTFAQPLEKDVIVDHQMLGKQILRKELRILMIVTATICFVLLITYVLFSYID